MKIFKYKHWIGIVALATLILSSCDFDRNKPGFSYFPDMEESQAYETYSPNPNYVDGKTMEGPVEGTVAVNQHAYNFVKTPEDELKAANLVNPYKDKFDKERAEKVFGVYCINCHGPKGDGKGFLFTSKKYPYPPANYHGDRAMAKTDGQLFHNIRVGFGVMGAHGPQLTVEETWQLVDYIRYLQSQPLEKN